MIFTLCDGSWSFVRLGDYKFITKSQQLLSKLVSTGAFFSFELQMTKIGSLNLPPTPLLLMY